MTMQSTRPCPNRLPRYLTLEARADLPYYANLEMTAKYACRTAGNLKAAIRGANDGRRVLSAPEWHPVSTFFTGASRRCRCVRLLRRIQTGGYPWVRSELDLKRQVFPGWFQVRVSRLTMDVLGSREGSCQGRGEEDGGGKESSRPHCGGSRMTELMVGFKQLEL